MSENSNLAVARLATAPQRVMQLASSFALMLGILGLLRTGFGGLTESDAPNLFVYPAHTLTAVVHLVVGLVGIAAATREDLSRTVAAAFAGLFVTWVLLCLLLDGDPSVVVARDAGLVGVTAAFAAAYVVAAVAPARRVAAVPDPALSERPEGAVRRPGA